MPVRVTSFGFKPVPHWRRRLRAEQLKILKKNLFTITLLTTATIRSETCQIKHNAFQLLAVVRSIVANVWPNSNRYSEPSPLP